MSQRPIGPIPERVAPRALLELPDGSYMTHVNVDQTFWHFILGEFLGTPLNRAGDLILKTN